MVLLFDFTFPLLFDYYIATVVTGRRDECELVKLFLIYPQRFFNFIANCFGC